MAGVERAGVTVIDKILSPELALGRDYYKVPTIRGNGSGRGYGFENLYLPSNWSDAEAKIKSFDWERFYTRYKASCEDLHVRPGELRIDSKTGLLLEILIDDNRNKSAILNTSTGEYIGNDIESISTAVITQSAIADFLTTVSGMTGTPQNYASIDWHRISAGQLVFYSHDLSLPSKALDSERPVTTGDYQARFANKAHNIAGSFGNTYDPRLVEFDELGILRSVRVNGNACQYNLERTGIFAGGYVPHNVDSLKQAAALHAITGMFVNDIMMRFP